MPPEVPFPDFHAAVATIAPVLMLGAIVARRWGHWGAEPAPDRATRWTVTVLSFLSAGAGAACLGVALNVLAGAWGSHWVVRVALIGLLGLQLTTAALAVLLDIAPRPRPEPPRRRGGFGSRPPRRRRGTPPPRPK